MFTILSRDNKQNLHHIQLDVVNRLSIRFSKTIDGWYRNEMYQKPVNEVSEEELLELIKEQVHGFKRSWTTRYEDLVLVFENSEEKLIDYILSTFKLENDSINTR